jgi:glutamate-1-semialdehyde 2,1-aminomutase
MLAAGVSFAPSPYEAGFVSLAHRVADIDKTLSAADKALQAVADVR